jgi:hypothetical protein
MNVSANRYEIGAVHGKPLVELAWKGLRRGVV